MSLAPTKTNFKRCIRTADDEHVVSLERICEVDGEEDFEEAEA